MTKFDLITSHKVDITVYSTKVQVQAFYKCLATPTHIRTSNKQCVRVFCDLFVSVFIDVLTKQYKEH